MAITDSDIIHPETQLDVSPPAQTSRLSSLTVADGLMVLIVLLSAVPRLYELGRLPLSLAEAEAALASWQFLRPVPLSVPVTSPAYFTFTNLFMAIGGSSDTLARIAPALAGIITVALVWLWRGRLKPIVYVVTGLGLALSPLLISTSRTAGGDAFAVLALMLLISAGLHLADGRRIWAYAFGAGIGLGLSSSPLFYSGLVVFAIAYWIYDIQAESETTEGTGLWRAHWRDVLFGGIVAFILFSTSFLFYPAGLGASLRLLPLWLGQFGLPILTAEGGAAILSPYMALIRYEPILVVIGLPAVIGTLWRNDNHRIAPAQWTVTAVSLALLLIILQPGVMSNALVALLPGFMLLGFFAERLFGEQPTSRGTWAVAGGLILLAMVLLVSLGRFTRLGLWTGSNMTLLGLATIAFVFAGIMVIVIIAWDNPSARQGIFIGLFLVLLYFQWGIGWHLNIFAANDPRERWVAIGTDEQIPIMVEVIRSTSRQTANSAYDLSIFSQVDSPVLRWYLRDYTQVEFGPALPVNAQQDAIITPVDAELRLPNEYFGADFGLQSKAYSGVIAPSVDGILRWWLFRDSNQPVDRERVILWLRSDLATAP